MKKQKKCFCAMIRFADCQDPTCKGKQCSAGVCEPKFLS